MPNTRPLRTKCDSSGQEFENKEILIKHIVDNHTVMGTHVIQRHICKVCNVEVHGEEAKSNHSCRKPPFTCSYCKQSFFSQEAQKIHICEQHQNKSVTEQLRALKRKTVECTHGVNCYRARRGRCWFKHTIPVQVSPHVGQGQQGTDQAQVQQPDAGRQVLQPQGQVQQQGQGQGQWLVQQGRGWMNSVQRYDQQITSSYYKELLHDCLNNSFRDGQHVAYHGNCPLQFLFMYELCSLYSIET